MNLKAVVFSGLMIAVLGPDSAASPNQYWILDAATPVRSQPKAQSEVKTYIRTGAGFQSAKRSGEWVYVEKRGGSILRGWVPASMVSEIEVDSAFLQERLRQATTNTDSILWFERFASLRPNIPVPLKGSQKAYAAAGDSAKATHSGRELPGANTIYLARHDGGDVLVFGAIDSTGGFRNLLWYEIQEGSDDSKFAVANDSSRAIKKKAMALRSAFASMAWYGCGSSAVPGNLVWRPIVPKVAPDTKKIGAFHVDANGRATFGISLGSSAYFYQDGRVEPIFATKPAFQVPVSGMKKPPEWDSLAWYRKDLVGNAFDSNGISELEYAALPEYGHVDIRMRGVLKNGYTTFEQRGIYDSRRKRVWPPEGQTAFHEEEDLGRIRARPCWFRFGPDASFPAFIVLPFSTHRQPPDFQEVENGNSGYQLLRIDGRGLKAFTIRSEYDGC